jgi:hypothetical protein
VRGYGWENGVDILFADLRYAARSLMGNPGFYSGQHTHSGFGHRPMTPLFSGLLFGVRSATDPITFVGVAVLLSLVALLASYVRPRRAMRLDPNTPALRVTRRTIRSQPE